MIEENPLARDRISQVYLGKVGDEETQIRARARINWLADQIDHSSVLDVGCSEGILPILLGRKGIKVTGVDINPEAIEFANELKSSEDSTIADNVTFICTDIINDFPEESQYDYVILGEIIEHFSKPDILINKAINFIKPGGFLLVTTPVGYFPDPDHHYTFTLSNFLEFFKLDNLTPIFLTVENGYIRFIAKKTILNQQSWNEIPENLLELNEQSFLKEQKIFYDRIYRLREQQRELSNINKSIASKNTKMEDQIRILEEKFSIQKNENERLNLDLSNLKSENKSLFTKLKGLNVRYRMILNSSAYQLSIEIREAFKPVGINTLLLPITFLKFFIRWLKKKNRVQLFITRIKSVFGKKSLSSFTDFNELAQETSFINSLNSFYKIANNNPDKPVIIISTGTKRMGNIKRINRTMAFARELAKMHYPVIYVYYQWKASDDFDSDYEDDFLLQLPNILFHKLSPQIASRFSNGNKLFILSIPDVHSVPELSLFKLHGWNTCYEVRDEWSEFYKAGAGKWYNPTFEIFLCSNANFVTTVSNRLHEKMIDLGSKKESTYVIPNGLNAEFLKKARPIFEKRKAGYKGKGIIGYFGHLTEKWFNWDLILKTANENPEIDFEIVGFDAPKSLNPPTNLKLLGEKTHEEIIEITESWSISIIPFKNNELSRAVDPIKLYEYQALGLPCVSCLMDQIIDYPFTFIYENDNDFKKTLQNALLFSPSQNDWEKLQEFVQRNTWKDRVVRTLDLAGIK